MLLRKGIPVNKNDTVIKQLGDFTAEEFEEIIRQAYVIGRTDERYGYPANLGSTVRKRVNMIVRDIEYQKEKGSINSYDYSEWSGMNSV